MTSRLWWIHALACSTLVVACKRASDSCDPAGVEWGVQLVIGASQSINLDAQGAALPTVVRLYQVRGELAMDELHFKTFWAKGGKDPEGKADTESLGEAFLSSEEMTIYPGEQEVRLLPVEAGATHIIAAAWFREPLGNTWYGTYEIPRRHPEVVCEKAPESKVYPNPCVYVMLDRSLVSGGPSPPPGFALQAGVQCAPLGVVPGEGKTRKKKRGKLKAADKLLDQNKPKTPDPTKPDLSNPDLSNPKIPDPKVPDPKLPDPKLPQQPTLPSRPTAPKAPTLPKPTKPSVP